MLNVSDRSEKLVVLDTNVIVSSIVRANFVTGLAVRYAQQRYVPVFSEQTIIEAFEVLARIKFDRYLPQKIRIDSFYALLSESTVVPVYEPVVACRDSRDDKFLSVAVAAGATLILTGDEDLLVLNPFRDIYILGPRDFLSTA